jgi:hypothetical protein
MSYDPERPDLPDPSGEPSPQRGPEAEGPPEGPPAELPPPRDAPPELPSYPRDPASPPPPPERDPLPELPSYPRDPGPRAEAPSPMLEGPELPSYPRDREADPKPARRLSGLQQAAVIGLGVVALLLVAHALTRDRAERPGEADALARAVAEAGTLEVVLATDDPARARQFARDEFGWRVGVPLFEGVELQGVAIAELAPAVEVPVFVYADVERGRPVAVFALSYALLDQVPERLRLARADYERLAEDDRPSVRRIRGSDVVLWRDRDDIFIAVTGIPPAQLTRRLFVAR